MKHYITILLFLIAALFSTTLLANKFAVLEQFVNDNKKQLGMPFGTSIAIVEDNKIVYQGNFGYADIELKQKVNDETPFYIASTTKPFFALATLLKENQGDIKENTPLNQLFPKLTFTDIQPQNISVKHLLTHTSGVDNELLGWAVAFTGSHTNELRHKMVAASYLSDESKLNEFDYTNIGYNILSVWFDDHYKQEWQRTLAQTVFQPLKMQHTSSYMSDAIKNDWNVAKPYSFKSEIPLTSLYLVKQDNTMQAAGGMISTAYDMGRFLIAQLNEGIVDGKQVFPSSVIKKFHKVQTEVNKTYGDFNRAGYAWGWYKGEYQKQQLLHHFGGYAGTFSHLSFMPERKIGLVILNNEATLGWKISQDISDIAYRIMLGQPESEIKKIADELLLSSLERSKKISNKVKAQKLERGSQAWGLTLDRSYYTGEFHHPLGGNIEININSNDQLFIQLGNLKATATPGVEENSVRVEFIPGSNGDLLNFNVKDGVVHYIDYEGTIYIKI